MREFFKRFRRTESDRPKEEPEPGRYPFTSSMPDIRKRSPDFKCNGNNYALALYCDVPSFNGLGIIHYNYAIAVLLHPGRLIGFITLERSSSMKNAFCFFDEQGQHHNLGDLSDEQDSDELILKGFISGAGMVLRDRFGIDGDDRWEPVGTVDKRYNVLVRSAGSR